METHPRRIQFRISATKINHWDGSRLCVSIPGKKVNRKVAKDKNLMRKYPKDQNPKLKSRKVDTDDTVDTFALPCTWKAL